MHEVPVEKHLWEGGKKNEGKNWCQLLLLLESSLEKKGADWGKLHAAADLWLKLSLQRLTLFLASSVAHEEMK